MSNANTSKSNTLKSNTSKSNTSKSNTLKSNTSKSKKIQTNLLHLNQQVINWKERREIKNKIKLIVEEFYLPSEIAYSFSSGSIDNISVRTIILSGSIYTPNNPPKTCLHLDFDHSKKDLYIEELNKCSINGSKNLINAIKIAKKLEYNTIRLGDFSEIIGNNCSYSLKIYNILLNGESWYNKYGLKSDQHNIEQQQIKKTRDISFINNIDKFMKKYKLESKTRTFLFSPKEYRDRIKNLIKNIWMSLQYIQTMYSINIKHQTKRVFKDLDIYRNTLKTDDEKEMFICVLSPIIELFKNNIKYDTSLSAHPTEFNY